MTLWPALGDAAFRPLLKWPGGKKREWRQIGPHVPPDVRHLVDPFMGGLAPFALTPFSGEAFLNDRHPLLVDLHRRVQAGDESLFVALDALAADWHALGALAAALHRPFVALVAEARRKDAAPDARTIADAALRGRSRPVDPAFRDRLAASLANKALRLSRLERKHDTHFDEKGCERHGETAVRAAYYTLVRAREHTATGGARAADFVFVRDFCYGSMFRTNSKGEFNIPYGGASYNSKSFARHVARLRSDDASRGLARATFHEGDFEAFLDELAPRLCRRDLVFIDPPYDSDFSTYGTNLFTIADHERLAAAMARCPARWLLVIKETPDVRRVYEDGAPRAAGGRVALRFGKQYGYNVRGRNARNVQHVILTNFEAPRSRAGRNDQE